MDTFTDDDWFAAIEKESRRNRRFKGEHESLLSKISAIASSFKSNFSLPEGAELKYVPKSWSNQLQLI